MTQSMLGLTAFIVPTTLQGCGNTCVFSTKQQLRNGIDDYINNGAASSNIVEFGVSAVTDFEGLFSGRCIANEDLSKWDTGQVTTMKNLLFDCANSNPNIGGWNVNAVKDLNYAFQGANAFNQDIGEWDISEVTGLVFTFAHRRFDTSYGAYDYSDDVENDPDQYQALVTFDQDLSKWNTHKVASMHSTFRGSVFNHDISGWNVGAVTSFLETFKFSEFNQDIDSWDVAQSNDFERMFQYSDFNQDISCWEVQGTADFTDMFDDSDLTDAGNTPPCWYDAQAAGCSSCPTTVTTSTATTTTITTTSITTTSITATSITTTTLKGSVLFGAVFAGATVIIVDDYTIYSVGDDIVLSRGTPNEEERTIIQITAGINRARRNQAGQLTLNQELTYGHPDDATVEILPPPPPPPPPGGGGGGGGGSGGGSKNTGLIVGLSVGAVVLVGLVVFLAMNAASPAPKYSRVRGSVF